MGGGPEDDLAERMQVLITLLSIRSGERINLLREGQLLELREPYRQAFRHFVDLAFSAAVKSAVEPPASARNRLRASVDDLQVVADDLRRIADLPDIGRRKVHVARQAVALEEVLRALRRVAEGRANA